MTFVSATVVGVLPPESITSSMPLSKSTPAAADINILVISPVSAVLRVPSTAPCVIITPATALIVCEVIVTFHAYWECQPSGHEVHSSLSPAPCYIII